MINKQTVTMLLAGLTVALVGAFGLATSVMAGQKCGDVDTAIIGGDVCQGVDNESGEIKDNAAWQLLIFAVQILTAGVGIAAVGGIVWASVLYTSASDNAQQTKQAMDIIKNVVIGIILYAGMYVLINFLIPGGIFN